MIIKEQFTQWCVGRVAANLNIWSSDSCALDHVGFLQGSKRHSSHCRHRTWLEAGWITVWVNKKYGSNQVKNKCVILLMRINLTCIFRINFRIYSVCVCVCVNCAWFKWSAIRTLIYTHTKTNPVRIPCLKNISSILNCLGEYIEECLLLKESEVIFKIILFPGYSLVFKLCDHNVSVGMSDCIIIWLKSLVKIISQFCVFFRPGDPTSAIDLLGWECRAWQTPSCSCGIRLRAKKPSSWIKKYSRRSTLLLSFAALDASCELAEKYGPYETYEGSPVSKGVGTYFVIRF